MTQGFVQIPRSLLDHPTVISCPHPQHRLLMVILQKMCFSVCTQDDHGKIVELQPGQLMCTYRQLEEWTKIPKSTCLRYLKCFVDVGILGQELGHTKTIITITHSDTCALLKKDNGTSFGTKVGQEWDKNGTQKNNSNNANNENKRAASEFLLLMENVKKFNLPFTQQFLENLASVYGIEPLKEKLAEFYRQRKDIDNPVGWLKHVMLEDYATL